MRKTGIETGGDEKRETEISGETRAMENEYLPMISPGMQSHLLLLLP